MIKRFDNAGLETIRSILNTQLAPIAAELGITLTVGQARFNKTAATFKLECTCPNEDGNLLSIEAQDYVKHAVEFGLPENGLNKPIRYGGQDYVIVGLVPRKHKRPVLLKRISNNKTYCFSPELTNSLLSLSVAKGVTV